MIRRYAFVIGVAILAFVAGMQVDQVTGVEAQGNQIYELRTYTTAEGRLPALLQRFGGGEIELFHKQGMKSVGYWVPADEPESQNTMIYVLAHDSREVAQRSWRGFSDDPAWTQMRAKSLESGPIVTNVESTFMNPTSFSPAK